MLVTFSGVRFVEAGQFLTYVIFYTLYLIL